MYSGKSSSQVFESNRHNANYNSFNDSMVQAFPKLPNVNAGSSNFTQFSNLNHELLSSVSQNLQLHDLSSMPQNLTMPDNSISLDLSSMSSSTLPQNLSSQTLSNIAQNLSTLETNQKELVSYPIPHYLGHQIPAMQNSTQPQNLSASSTLNDMSQIPGKIMQPQNLSIDHLVQPENLTVPQNLTLNTQRRNACVDNSRQDAIEHALPQNLSCQNLGMNNYGLTNNNYGNVVAANKSVADPLLYGGAMQDLSTLMGTDQAHLPTIQDLSCNHKMSQNHQELVPQNLSLNTTLEPQNLSVSLRPENLSYNKTPAYNSTALNSSFIMPQPQNLSQSHTWM